MNREHIDPNTGFPSPTQVNSELGARFTQKLNERIILSLSASTAQIRGYHQWDDLSDSNPTYIQEYITLPKIQMKKAGASLQWDFARYWQASGLYEWTEGDNTGNDVFNLTALPQNRGILSLYRGDDQWESRLEWVLVSSTNAFATTQATLPAYNILNLSLTYHLSKLFSLWFQGENLLGEGYQVQPGYIEPQYHIRGGVELIF
jgi:outer membrane cobalamin receptor